MKITDIILIIVAVITALMAGIFYSFSVAVSPGLSKLTDSEYIKAMQSINREIQNPLFFINFFGVLILLPLLTFQQFSYSKELPLLLLTSLIFYVVGVFGVTAFVNVPLNNQLDAFNLSTASSESINSMRKLFEPRWNFWNNIRTAASVVTFIVIMCTCLFHTTHY